MEYIYSVLIGYLIGTISPAAIISKIKKTNLKETGTKNLGATNTMLTFGKAYGVFVMVFDILKAFFAVKLAQILFPEVISAGIISGAFAVVGHIFPFYLKFRGGKGLAAYGGMLLGIDPFLFLVMLVITVTIMFIVNYGFAMPMSAAVIFPFAYWVGIPDDTFGLVIAILVSVLLFVKHIPNILRAKRGEDSKIREYVKSQFKK